MKSSCSFLVCSMCSLVLLGSALAATPPGKKPPAKPRSAQKSSTATARQSARRASVSQRSTYSARVSGASAASQPTGAGSQGAGGRAAVAARASGVSLSGVKSPRDVGDYELDLVRSTLAGATRRISLPGELNVCRAANLSASHEADTGRAIERVRRQQTPLRRHSVGGTPYAVQVYARAFVGSPQVRRTGENEEIPIVRYIRSGSPEVGAWYTPLTTPLSAEEARDGLSLPDTPTHFRRGVLLPGTTYVGGTVAAAFGGRGGLPQIYVPHPGRGVRIDGDPQPLPQ